MARGLRLLIRPPIRDGARSCSPNPKTRAASDHTLPQLVALMFAMAVLILAIASANASGLLLSRAEVRAMEIAVRMALGATRARLAMDSMLEAAVLALAGAALGIPVAWAAIRLLARIATLPTDFPFAIAPRMDPRVVLIAAIATTLAAIACGCGPALASPRVAISRSLAHGGRAGSRSSKWRNLLVTVEIAAASALVATGASLVVQVKSAIAANPGYRTDHVLVMALDPAQTGYTRAASSAFYERLLTAVRALPGVNQAALAQSAVLSYTRTPAQVEIDHEAVSIWMNAVTPGYFALMRMPLAAGRAFDDRDTESSMAVAIVNEELARRCGISRLDGGARLRVNGALLQVIGIARNAKYFEIQESPQPYLYLPYSQHFASRMVLHVETAGDPARAARPILEEIRRIDPSQPVSELRPLRDYLEQGSMFAARIAIHAIGAVGLCALVLALAGIFGVVSHAVASRRREIGIRIALGAEPQAIIMMILRGIAAPVATGTVGGLVVSTCASKLLASLAGSGLGHPGDVGEWGFAGASAVAIACLIAALIPATRAAHAAHSHPAEAFGQD